MKLILSTKAVWILALLFASMVAGCLVSDDGLDGENAGRNGSETGGQHTSPNTPSAEPPPPPAPEPDPTVETGALQGQVIDDNFKPIIGAWVELRNATGTMKNVTTDSDGKYTMNGILPGRYIARFDAPCCEPQAHGVRIQADGTRTLSPILEIWAPSREGHYTEHSWTGFISCDSIACSGVMSLDPNDDRSHSFEVARGIRTVVVALDWSEGGLNTEDCLGIIFRVQHGRHDDYFPSHILHTDQICESIEKPIEFRVDAGTITDGKYDFLNITDWMPLQFNVNGGYTRVAGSVSITTNTVLQQPFTVYWKEFYWEHAPDDVTALPKDP